MGDHTIAAPCTKAAATHCVNPCAMTWTNNHAPASTISRISSVTVFPLSPHESKIVPDHVPRCKMPRASPALNRGRRTPQGSRHRGRDPGLVTSDRALVHAPGGAAKAVLSRLSPPPEKGPASFSRRRVRIWQRLRACWAISTLVGRPRIDAPVCRCSGLDLRDVFPTGCVAGRAERAARPPRRRLRRWAELD